MNNLLWILLLIPAAGALIGAFIPASSARIWALLVSLATLGVAIGLAVQFYQQPVAGTPIKFENFHVNVSPAHGTVDTSFSLSIDAISLSLLLLTAGLTPLALLSSYESIKDRAGEYYAWMLLLLAAMLGVFVANDLLLFYIFFELTLIPMFFIIGIWGGPDRRFAAGKFFLFTFTGSVFTLAGAIYLGTKVGTFDIASVTRYAQLSLTSQERYWILLAFLAGFAVKVPLFPVHTWLPLAHTEAPTAGSVILAGVLLKLGTYGLLRLAVPIGLLVQGGTGVAFPQMITFIAALCLIGIVYGALVAWVQQDIKKLVAYSSVSHLGFCVLGLVALNPQGVEGSVLYMINHGVSTGALFLVIGMIYDRYHTRDINKLSGLARRMPVLAFFFILFTFSSIGLPGLNGFWSEFLTILGAFTSNFLGARYGAVAALGIILGAVYMLHMAAKVIWGPLKTPDMEESHGASHGSGHGQHAAPGDIGAREIAILVPLALAVVWLGVYPTGLMRTLNGPVNQLLGPVQSAAAKVAQMPNSAEPAGTMIPHSNLAGSALAESTHPRSESNLKQ